MGAPVTIRLGSPQYFVSNGRNLTLSPEEEATKRPSGANIGPLEICVRDNTSNISDVEQNCSDSIGHTWRIYPQHAVFTAHTAMNFKDCVEV